MRLILFFSLLNIAVVTWSQGCSDAGFCTMGAMRPDQPYNKEIDFKLRSFEFNYYNGKTLLTPIVTVYTADLNFSVNDYYSLQVKIPYQTVSGRLGDTRGVGDFSISASRSFPLKKNYSLGVTLGGKIPSGKSNIKEDNNDFGSGDLPMYYQVSLGTYDVVAGASVINEKWLFATGIQIPVYNQNENDFRWGKWADAPDPNYVREYTLANDLKRGTDVMLRAERNFRFINFNFGLGLLGIYRITKDQRYDFNIDETIKMDGSTGLALNALANVGYQFNVNHSIKFIHGKKLMDREHNADGLTRKHVHSLSYVYKF